MLSAIIGLATLANAMSSSYRGINLFMRGIEMKKRWESLFALNRKILNKIYYVKKKGRVLRSYKVLETLVLEEKNGPRMVVKYRERIFLKNGTIREKNREMFQDIKILEHKLGRTF